MYFDSESDLKYERLGDQIVAHLDWSRYTKVHKNIKLKNIYT